MSTYNILGVSILCPWCNTFSHMELELFFGYGNLISYKIGDRVEWLKGKSVKNGGRPEHGNMEGEGYTECPNCQRDFFVKVHVESDVIVGVEPDMNKKPYILG